MPKKYNSDAISPERTKIWIEPPKSNQMDRKVPIVYYLCQNGQLEHPHFMEVPLSSPQGLCLKDVINRLNFLRGPGMANMYSWSSKRSYRNGFVWQDLAENDFIYPAHGNEYILKGSRFLENSSSFRSSQTESSSTSISKNSSETNSSTDDSNCSDLINTRTNQSWNSLDDFCKYKIYKAEMTDEFAKKAANASTQTVDERRKVAIESTNKASSAAPSPPLPAVSFSGSGGLGSTRDSIEGDGSANIQDQSVGNDRPSGRMKASAVLMQLISCGSTRVNDFESTESKGLI